MIEEEKNNQMEMEWVVPENWDNISSEKGISLDLRGEHICKIVNIKKYHTSSGEISYKVDVDIDDENDKYNGYFIKEYYLNGNKWPNSGTKYLSLKSDNLNYFKAFIEDLEESNDVKLNVKSGQPLDRSQFDGLKIGAVFTLEEYEKDGNIRVGVSPSEFVSLQDLGKQRRDTIRLIGGQFIDYSEYQGR